MTRPSGAPTVARGEAVVPAALPGAAEPAGASLTATRLRAALTHPYVLLACLALVWGIHWPVAKIGLRYLPPFTYAALRVVTALATLAVLTAPRRGFRRPSRHDLPIVLSVGLGQIAAAVAIMNLALPLVAAGRASVLVYTMPLWVALIELPAARWQMGRRQAAGLLLGLAGILLLLDPGAIDWGSGRTVLGSASLVGSAVIWAATTIHIRRHRWQATPLDLEPWQLLVALVPLLALTLLLEQGRTIHWEPTALIAVAYSGPLATALAFWLSQSISRALSPLATTIGFLSVPVVGLLSAAVMLGEPVTPLDLAATATVMVGIVLVSTARRASDPT